MLPLSDKPRVKPFKGTVHPEESDRLRTSFYSFKSSRRSMSVLSVQCSFNCVSVGYCNINVSCVSNGCLLKQLYVNPKHLETFVNKSIFFFDIFIKILIVEVVCECEPVSIISQFVTCYQKRVYKS